MQTTSVYIVEDHPFMRETLEQYLGSTPGVDVCGLAVSAEEALDALPELPAGLLLVDVSLPGMDGLAFAREVQKQRPDLHCVMLSGHHEETYVERARDAGARGYVRKGDPVQVVEAIREVAAGGEFWG